MRRLGSNWLSSARKRDGSAHGSGLPPWNGCVVTGSCLRGGASPARGIPGHPVSILGGARPGRELVDRLTYLGFEWARFCLRTTVTAAGSCPLGGAPSRGCSERGTGLPATASSPKAPGDREDAYRGTNWDGDGLPRRDGGAWREGGAVLGGENDCRRSPSLGSLCTGTGIPGKR
jgi:hypothetical protein